MGLVSFQEQCACPAPRFPKMQKKMPLILPPSFPGGLAEPLEIDEQIPSTLELRIWNKKTILVWSVNSCWSSQPGPWEAKSPAQRHPYNQTGKPRRTGLPHPPPGSLLPGPVPQDWCPMGSLPSHWVCKKAPKHVTFWSSLFPQPLGGKGKSLPNPILQQTKRGKGRANSEVD